MEPLLRPSGTSWGTVPPRARPYTCDWQPGIYAKWPSRFRVGGTAERWEPDDTRQFGLHTGVFVLLGARPRSVCRIEASFGASFRSTSSYAAMRGPIPLRSKRRVPGPECRRVSGMVPHPRTHYVRGSAGSHAGGLCLLFVSPPDRTAVLRSGSQLISAISPETQAVHFLRGRSSKATPRSCRFEAEPAIAAAPRGDPPCDHPVVHHRNPAG